MAMIKEALKYMFEAGEEAERATVVATRTSRNLRERHIVARDGTVVQLPTEPIRFTSAKTTIDSSLDDFILACASDENIETSSVWFTSYCATYMDPYPFSDSFFFQFRHDPIYTFVTEGKWVSQVKIISELSLNGSCDNAAALASSLKTVNFKQKSTSVATASGADTNLAIEREASGAGKLPLFVSLQCSRYLNAVRSEACELKCMLQVDFDNSKFRLMPTSASRDNLDCRTRSAICGLVADISDGCLDARFGLQEIIKI